MGKQPPRTALKLAVLDIFNEIPAFREFIASSKGGKKGGWGGKSKAPEEGGEGTSDDGTEDSPGGGAVGGDTHRPSFPGPAGVRRCRQTCTGAEREDGESQPALEVGTMGTSDGGRGA